MNNRNLSLAMLGIGGLGVLGLMAAGTDRGRSILRNIFDALAEAPDRIQGWNESAQEELEHLQSAINDLADALGAAHYAE